MNYNNIVIANADDIPQYSYSKLNTYNTCPYSYYLTYVSPDRSRGRQNGFAAAGSIAHNIIDEFYKGQYSEYDLPQVFLDRWQEEFIDEGFQVLLRTGNGFVKNLTTNYFNDFWNYFNNFVAYDNCNVVGTEIKFNLLLNREGQFLNFGGIMDCLGESKSDYIVWDSKSKSKWKDQAQIDEYARQLYAYSIAVEYLYGKLPIELRFNQFRLSEDQRVTRIKFDKKHYFETIDWIFDTDNQIREDTLWLPNCGEDKFFCENLCGHYFHCVHANPNAEEIDPEY